LDYLKHRLIYPVLQKSGIPNSLDWKETCWAIIQKWAELETLETVDPDTGLSFWQNINKIIPDGHPNKPSFLNKLGIIFQNQFMVSDKVADIDKAVAILQGAIDLTTNGHGNKPDYLDNLGISLLRRFERFGVVTDVDNSILANKQAVDLTPDGHPNKPMRLSNLGNSLLGRFERFGVVADIDNSILANQQAVDLTPDGHASKPMYLNNLGISLLRRFERFGVVADVDNSILANQQAVDLTPDGHASKPMYLSNLGNSLSSRLIVSEETTDIIQAIFFHRQAVNLTPDGSSQRSTYLHNLGLSLKKRFYSTFRTNDLQDSLSSFRDSATSYFGLPHDRLTAARQWALLAADHTPHNDRFMPLNACRIIMSLVPRVIWLGNSISLRYQDIAEVGNAVTMAASIACQYAQPDLALEWLEQGRSIVWEQTLHLRTPMDALKCDRPHLAASLERISSQLKALDVTPISLSASDKTAITMNEGSEMNAQRYRRLVEEWEATLIEVRQCQGYERFLLPKKLDELALAAALGPIIYINIDERRCDAIILQYINGKPNLDHVHLSLASQKKIKNSHAIFSDALISRDARWSSDLTSLQLDEAMSEDDLCVSAPVDLDTDEILDSCILSDISDSRATKPKFQLRSMQRVLKMLWKDIVEPIFQRLGYTDTVCFPFYSSVFLHISQVYIGYDRAKDIATCYMVHDRPAFLLAPACCRLVWTRPLYLRCKSLQIRGFVIYPEFVYVA
jgi:hypothetical protein